MSNSTLSNKQYHNEMIKLHFDEHLLPPKNFTFIRKSIFKCNKPDETESDYCSCRIGSTCSIEEQCVLACVYTKCSSLCQCNTTCKNNRISQNKFKQCKVYKTEKMGYGLRVLEACEKGDLILEYLGEIFQPDQINSLIYNPSNDYQNLNYALSLTLDSNKKLYVDARLKGGLSRFINHSCDPNCIVQTWYVDGLPRTCIFANTTIEKGDALSFDYNWISNPNKVLTYCHCGSNLCRQFIERTLPLHTLIPLSYTYQTSAIPLQINDFGNNSYINSVLYMLYSCPSFIIRIYFSYVLNNYMN